MNQFLSEIHKKYTKIAKSDNLIGFLNRLAVFFNLTDSQPLDIYPFWIFDNLRSLKGYHCLSLDTIYYLL